MQNEISKATKCAYRQLKLRVQSCRELCSKLERKGFSPETVQKTMSLLEEKGLIDDKRFAEIWVSSKLKMRPTGAIVLKRELAEKGIREDIVESILSDVKSSESEVIRELAKKRIKQIADLPKLKAAKRLHDFLLRRGFEFDAVKDTVNEIIKDEYEK